MVNARNASNSLLQKTEGLVTQQRAFCFGNSLQVVVEDRSQWEGTLRDRVTETRGIVKGREAENIEIRHQRAVHVVGTVHILNLAIGPIRICPVGGIR